MSDNPDMFDTYKSMLHLARMETTAEGFVRMEIEPGEYIPVTAKDRKLVVLPYDERLRDPKCGEYEIFHLLRENGPKDSDLLSRYRHWLINRFNLVIGGLGSVILHFIANKEIIKRMSPDQKDFLDLVIDVDGEAVKRWSAIADVTSTPNQIQQVFVSLYLRQAAVLRGQSYNRVATVNFPFYEALKQLDIDAEAYKAAPKTQKPPKPDDKIFGCEVKVKDRQPFLGLMRYLVPNLDVPNHYDVGSNARIAPSLDAMMSAWLQLGRHLNAITERLIGVSPDHDRILKELVLDLDWAKAFEDLELLWPQIRSIPVQSTGAAVEPPVEAVDPRKRAQATQAAATPAPGTYVAPPWEAPKPAPYQSSPYQTPVQPASQRATGGGMSVGEMNRLLGGGQMPQQQQYQYYPGQQPPPYQSGYSQPAYPQNGGYQPPLRRY